MPEFQDLGIIHSHESVCEEVKEDGPKKIYPCLYITSKEPIDLGDEGTAQIKYKLIERSQKNRNDKEEFCYELEVYGIAPIESEEIEEDMPSKKEGKRLTQNFGEMLERAQGDRAGY